MAAQTKFATIGAQGSIKSKMEGIKMSDIYVTNTNNFVPLENVTYANDVSFSLNTLNPGSTATVSVPSMYKLVQHAYIMVRLKGVRDANDLPGIQAAHPYTQQLIAPSIFSEIAYQIPGMERQVFKPGSLLPIIMDSCPDSKRRLRIAHIMGNGDSIGDWSGAYPVGAGTEVDHIVYLPLPLPNLSFEDRMERAPKPLPIHLLGESFQLMFKFNEYKDYMKQDAWNNLGVNVGGIVYTNMHVEEARVFLIYQNLSAAPEYKTVVAKFPFQMVYGQTVSVNRRPIGAPYHVNLPGIRQGETTQFIIRLSNYSTTTNLEGFRLQNIVLNYGGYNIWVAEESNVDYYDNLYNESPGYLDSTKIEAKKSDNLTLARIFYYHIPLSRQLAHIRGIHNYSIGCDFNNSEVKLSFDVHTGDHYRLDATMALHVDQYVTSVMQFNGQTAMLIQ